MAIASYNYLPTKLKRMKLKYAFSVSAVLIIVLIMLYSNEKKEPQKLKQLHMEGGEDSLSLGLAAKVKNMEMIEPRPQLVEHNDTENSHQKPPLKLLSEIMEGVKKFVFFVGYSRSGHSIRTWHHLGCPSSRCHCQ